MVKWKVQFGCAPAIAASSGAMLNCIVPLMTTSSVDTFSMVYVERVAICGLSTSAETALHVSVPDGDQPL